jgi:hypothetical protein
LEVDEEGKEAGAPNFIDSHGIIRGKGLQFPSTNFVDKTLKPPESTYKTTFLVLSRIWYKICTRAWSPFPLIIPWKTMKLRRPQGWGSGFEAQGLEFRVWGVKGFRVRVEDSRFEVCGSGSRV